MTSDDILDVLDNIAATPGKNDKTSLLTAYADDVLLQRVLVAMLDPLTTYGIRALPERIPTTSEDGAQFTDSTWKIIEDMAARRLTGSAMQAAVEFEINALSVKSADLFGRILLKDPRAGFGENTTNKAIPGLIREFPYMRCSLPKGDKLQKLNWGAGIVSQEKADGMYMNVNHVAGGAVMLFSRSGTMYRPEAFGVLIDDVRRTFPEDHQMQGEMLVMRDGSILPREEGNGVLNHIESGGSFAPNERPLFMAWDQVPLSHVRPKGKYEVGYLKRLAKIVAQIKEGAPTAIRLIPTRIVKSLSQAYAHYGEMLAAGKEGTILKLPEAIWKDGTSSEQFKLKLEFTVDLEVVAVVPGRQHTKNEGRAGSLTCESDDGQLRVDVAIKGEKMRDAVDADQNDWIGRIMPVTANMVMAPSESNELHSLFLPRFAESKYRTDKKVADTLERVIEQQEAAKLGAAILKEAA